MAKPSKAAKPAKNGNEGRQTRKEGRRQEAGRPKGRGARGA